MTQDNNAIYLYQQEDILTEKLPWTFKGNHRFSRIHPCQVDNELLKKLFETLEEIQSKALDLELARVNKMMENAPKDFSKKDCKQLKKDITDNYKVHIEIWSKHEFFTAKSSSIFDKLPNEVIRIKYDNNFFYKTRFNREPISVFKIDLDFTEPPLIDFNVSASLPTKNNSTVQIYSDDATWVEGAYGRVTKLLEDNRIKRAWLHKANVYDYFIWFLILPFTFWTLYKIDLKVHTYLSHISPAFMVFFYLFMFMLVLMLFRCLFGYFKWLFPYMELETSPKRGFRKHRKILSILYFAVIGALVYDIVSGIIKLVF